MNGEKTCFEIEKLCPLDFIHDFKQSDRKLIFDSIKSFKNPLNQSQSVKFYDSRDIHIIAEFYSRYGKTIRYVYKNFISYLKFF